MHFAHILALTGLAGLVASQVTVGPIEVDVPFVHIDDDDFGDFTSGTLTVIVAGSTVVVEVTESTTITINPKIPWVTITPDDDDDDDDNKNTNTQAAQPTQGSANPATVGSITSSNMDSICAKWLASLLALFVAVVAVL